MIEIQDLLFRYGDAGFALRIPELRMEAASQVAIVGPSGSGKTTLLYLLAGILVAEAGQIRVANTDLARLHDRARRDFRISQVGLVFQDFELLEYLNVRENILLPYRINRRLRLTQEVRIAAERWAERMGIGQLLRRPIGQLSQGERQRVAICRALLPQPGLLLADEPTGNLDPINARHIIELLCEQSRLTGATLVVVTHDHSLLSYFPRIIDLMTFQTRMESAG
jgi:putative ABC transport system ATP-binding protein